MFLLTVPRRYFLLWIIYVISVVCVLCFYVRLFIVASWPPAGKGLTTWLSFMMSNCEFATFPWYPKSSVVLDCIDF